VSADETICPLCLDGETRHYHRDRRPYRHCRRCDLVYVPASFHLDPVAEKRRYDQHRNDPGDPAYRAFLSRLMQPLLERLPAGAQGLDYGSGPGPTLSLMLAECGHPMNIYDAFYAPCEAILARRYDFLTCSETMEHFATPAQEWRRFLKLVREGGWIGIMTQLREAGRDFSDWYYKNDDTHVSFYSRATFEFLARQHDLRLWFEGTSVILLQR